MKKFKTLKEEIINTASGANISGLPPTDPPVSKKHNPILFAGKRVFKVSSNAFNKAKLGKMYRKHYKTYVEGDIGEEIRQYAKENPDAPIIVEDELTGAMVYLRYGKR